MVLPNVLGLGGGYGWYNSLFAFATGGNLLQFSFPSSYYTQIHQTASFLSSCPLTRACILYDLILLPHALYDIYLMLQFDLAIPMYDTHLRATHTTTSSTRGVQISIYLVSSIMDSL